MINQVKHYCLPGVIKLLLTLSLLLLCNFSAMAAEDDSVKSNLIERKILGLYNELDLESDAENKIQLHAQSVLNHFGYYVDALDINAMETLPDDKKMEEYKAILIWFDEPGVPDADQYVDWLEKQVGKGKKLIIWGYTGVEVDLDTLESLDEALKNRVLSLLDLDYFGAPVSASRHISLVQKKSEMVEFERNLENPPGSYSWITPKDNTVKSWLVIKNTKRANSDSSVVATSEQGGYVHSDYIIWEESFEPFRRQWRLNPFLFFREIFGNETVPIPDPTTKNGRRVFYSHVDGDAFNSLTQIRGDTYSSEIVEDLIKEFPEIKVGISLVVAEVDPKQKGNQKLVEIAKRILALENVEIASHSYNHPYLWRGPDRTSAFNKKPFDLDHEIRGSIDYINKELAPKGKKLKAFYWTGDTFPPVKAFTMLDELKVLNINGGDGMFDAHYPSYTGISPLVRNMGPYWQVHSSQSNENLYTSLWTTDFNGFANVIQTYEKTDSPRRFSAANSYYHFYTGDRHASIEAVRKTYQWALDNGLEIVYPSEYIRMVQGFISAKVIKEAPNQYRIKDRGALNTFRLDKGDVNFEKSVGVIKVNQFNDSRYITLDPDVEVPLIQVVP